MKFNGQYEYYPGNGLVSKTFGTGIFLFKYFYLVNSFNKICWRLKFWKDWASVELSLLIGTLGLCINWTMFGEKILAKQWLILITFNTYSWKYTLIIHILEPSFVTCFAVRPLYIFVCICAVVSRMCTS